MMPDFSQFGIGMPQQNPFSQFGIMQDPASLLGGTGGGFWSGLHGPQLSDWGGGVGGMMQIAAIPGALDSLFTYRDPDQGWLGGGLQGAAQGAGVGSMFGPIGTGIGAGTGYMAGKK